MDATWKRLVPLAGILSLAGCAAQRYQAAPIVPSATASRFESRNLADSGLQSFVEQNLGHSVSHWPPATLDFAIPIETAGKRGYRMQAARSLDQATRFDLADSAWTVTSGVRAALLNYIIASQTLELFRSEETVRQDQVNILEQIFSAGEIPRQNVDLARIELSKAHLAI